MPDTRHRTRLEAAAIGLRLAEALSPFAGDDAALSRALDFCARFAGLVGLDQAALAAARDDDGAHPLDRMTALSRDGGLLADLALLACLPEIHEGFAALLRLLHRDARSEASVALALRWLEAEQDDPLACRDRVEDVLLHASVAALGLLRCVGDGPWHGRALRPGPGLWAALNGRAPDAEMLAGFRAVPGLEAWIAQPDAAALAEQYDGGHTPDAEGRRG